MRLMRLSKKLGKQTILGNNSEIDINWASGPGFRDGPENYFCISPYTSFSKSAIAFIISSNCGLACSNGSSPVHFSVA